MANPDESAHRTALGISGGSSADSPSAERISGAPASDALIGVVIGGRYRIERILGEGGMGAVYQAEHTLMRKRLAVKVLHAEMSRLPEVVARFEREAMAAAHIEHPNVAAASDFGKLDDGSFFLVLEFVEGTSLRDAVGRGPFPVQRALHILRQITGALQRAHAMGIVHRDLKPENVMLVAKDGDGDFVKVLDFGIAKVPVGDIAGEFRTDKPGQVLTRQGMLYGTPEYMAPEQALGQDVDARADLYALGVMAFEMISGKRPFDHESKVTLLGMHVTAPIPTFADRAPGLEVPPGVEAMIRKLLAKESTQRFADARELEATIASLMEGATLDEQGRPRISSHPGTGTTSRPSFGGPNLSRPIGTPAAMAGTPGSLPIVATKALGSGGIGIVGFPRERKSQRTWVAVAAAAAVVVLIAILALARGRSKSPDKPEVAPNATSGSAQPVATSKPGVDGEEDDLEIIAPTPGSPAAEALARDLKAVEDLLDSGQASAAMEKLRSLRRRRPKDVNVRRLLVRAYSESKQTKEAMGEALGLIESSPEAAGDPVIIGAIRDAALDNEVAAFDILERRMGPSGLDILYDIAFPKGGSRAPAVSRRAAEVLAKPSVRERATPALAIALKLRAATRCEAYRDLLTTAKESGDSRAQTLLQPLTKTTGCGFVNARDCYPCLRKDGRLDAALKAIEQRSPKSQ